MDLFFEVALFLTPKIGNKTFRVLINHFKSAENVFNASLHDLAQVRGLRKDAANNILKKNTFKKAKENIEAIKQNNGKILYYQDKEYPQRLLRITDFPPMIFTTGQTNLNPSKAISIVGTRNMTNYGKGLVHDIIEQISSHQPQIISGLAYGVDLTAHRQALENKLDTVAVMATGLDKIYPKEHLGISKEIKNQGALVTEYPYDSKPDAMKFPARNRIIAGLSDVVIVVEATTKGGALITANFANQYNIDVLACPGRVDDNFNQGCNQLIANYQAHIYTSPDSITNLLNWDKVTDLPPKRTLINHLSGRHEKTYQAIATNNSLDLISLCKITNIGRGTLLTILLELEIQSLIIQQTGGQYVISNSKR